MPSPMPSAPRTSRCPRPRRRSGRRSRERTGSAKPPSEQGIIMHSFTYHRPANVKAAQALLAKAKDASLLAGGQTLIPSLKLRLTGFENIVDLKAIKGLDKIEVKGKNLLIGAMATHGAVATSLVVKKAIPALAKLAGMIGDPAVRNVGTIGGFGAKHQAAADYPGALLSLDGTGITSE